MHAKHRFAIVHVQARFERKIWNDGGVNVRQTQARMLGEDVASAGLAPFAIALGRLVVGADVLFAMRDLHALGLPQREGIHWTRGPLAA